MRTFLLSVAVAVFGLISAGEAAPILVNGSFENGPAMNGPLCPISPSICSSVDIVAGSAAIPGWEVFAESTSGAAVDYLGPGWDVSDGSHAIDLDGRGAVFSGVRQTFATSAGQRYDVFFDLSGNTDGGAALKRVRVTVGGLSQDYAHDSTGQSSGNLLWDAIGLSFIASGPTTTLSFMSLTGAPSSYGALIDNASVAIPEPTYLLLLASGLAAMQARRR